MAAEAFSEYTFEQIELSPALQRAVRELGFEKMTPIQAQAIPALLTGRDVIGQAQTGTGKTAAFGLPILQQIDPENKNVQAIILCPTRELAVQAADDLRGFAKYMHDVKVLPVYGGQDILRQIQGMKGVQIVVGTPGRVMDHMRRHTLKLNDVRMVVLDEADEMLDMGFREDMEVILGAMEQPHQTCLFSATMPQPILDMTDQFQKDPLLIRTAEQQLTIDTVAQYYYPIRFEYKTEALKRLLSCYRYSRSIIFCNTKTMVDELTAELQKAGYTAEGLHGDLSQKQRDYVMGRFRSGTLNILLATDIAARGIDVDDVEAVFNYDLPQENEYYVHRIGRTGRAGKEGVSHSLCRSRDLRRIHEIEVACHCEMTERKIPTVDEIRLAKQNQTLEDVLAVLNDGHSGSLIPVVRAFCEEKNITMDALAAAFVRKEMGALPEDLQIDLPSREELAARGGRDRRRDGRGRRVRRDDDSRRWGPRDDGESQSDRRDFRKGRSGRDEESAGRNRREDRAMGEDRRTNSFRAEKENKENVMSAAPEAEKIQNTVPEYKVMFEENETEKEAVSRERFFGRKQDDNSGRREERRSSRRHDERGADADREDNRSWKNRAERRAEKNRGRQTEEDSYERMDRGEARREKYGEDDKRRARHSRDEEHPGKHDHDEDRRPGKHDHDADRRPGKHDHNADRRPGKHDHDADRRPGKHDHDADRRPGKHDHDADRRSKNVHEKIAGLTRESLGSIRRLNRDGTPAVKPHRGPAHRH